MNTLLAAASTEGDSVNLLPFLVATVVLAVAAAVVFLRRRGK